MRWERGERGPDLEDRRGSPARRVGVPFGLGGLVLLFVLSVVFKQDFFSLLQTVQDPGAAGPGSATDGAPYQSSPEEEQLVDFVNFVVKDAQDVWTLAFQQLGRPYERAKLVLFTDATQSGCGYAAAAMGPFYCPADAKVYIDLGFYRELKSRFGAPGDFAQAYVIAHEVGHHVQTLLGLERTLNEARERRPNDANELSVRFELQADCLAGVWANSTEQRQILAGISQHYEPETLVGRNIAIVANLKPAKMMGLESQGMICAASLTEDDTPALATFLEDVKVGARLK